MFYKTGVDISNIKSMWEFLHNHPTYSTMNSWNGHKSIAHNVKLYNLNLEGDWTKVLDFLCDEADCGNLQMFIQDEIAEFNRANPCYRACFNGRSGGYLVLYNKDNYLTVLPDCLGYECYEDFKEDYTGYGYSIQDCMWELRETTKLVREFDKLCDRLRDLVNSYSKEEAFDKLKLENAVERFNYFYGDDLDDLDLEGPVVENDHVNLNDIAGYRAFMDCFESCLGDDKRRAYIDEDMLFLKRD